MLFLNTLAGGMSMAVLSEEGDYLFPAWVKGEPMSFTKLLALMHSALAARVRSNPAATAAADSSATTIAAFEHSPMANDDIEGSGSRVVQSSRSEPCSWLEAWRQTDLFSHLCSAFDPPSDDESVIEDDGDGDGSDVEGSIDLGDASEGLAEYGDEEDEYPASMIDEDEQLANVDIDDPLHHLLPASS